ncbi:hypothetical protein JB92DRAFT_2838377 [Gautieria morchelliformis]|nr:hypothetical protein JB92DRAFT_2838377 [Gautieria morchelliformis]
MFACVQRRWIPLIYLCCPLVHKSLITRRFSRPRSEESKAHRNLKASNIRMHKLVYHALQHPVQFPHIEISKEIQFRTGDITADALEPTPSGNPWTIEDHNSFIAVDKHGKELLLMIRGFAAPKTQNFTKHIKLKEGRNPISRSSADIIAYYSESCQFMLELEYYSNGLNEVFQGLDPAQHAAHVELRKNSTEEAGRTVIANRITGRHIDRRDPPQGWAAIGVIGPFRGGGYMRFPRLNARIRFSSGDLFFIRGGCLEHEVEAWTDAFTFGTSVTDFQIV